MGSESGKYFWGNENSAFYLVYIFSKKNPKFYWQLKIVERKKGVVGESLGHKQEPIQLYEI